jgi:hypothetical protein
MYTLYKRTDGVEPRILEPGEYRDCRWAVIDRPQEGAQHVERV